MIAADAIAPIQTYKGWLATANGGSQKINWYLFSQGVYTPNIIPLYPSQTLDDLTSLTFVMSGYASQPFVRIYTMAEGDGQDMVAGFYRSSVLAYFTSPISNADTVTFTFDATTDAYAQPISSTLSDTGKTLSKAANFATIRAETLAFITLQTSSGSFTDLVVHEVRAKFASEGVERVMRLYDDDTPFLGTDDVTAPFHLRTSTPVQVGVTQSTAVEVIAPDELQPIEDDYGWKYSNNPAIAGAKFNWYFFKHDYANIAAISVGGNKLDDLNSLTFTISGSASDLYVRIYTKKDGGSNKGSWYKSSVLMHFGTVSNESIRDFVFDMSGVITSWTGYSASGTLTLASSVDDVRQEMIDRVSIQTGSGSSATDLIVHRVKASFQGESAERVINLGVLGTLPSGAP